MLWILGDWCMSEFEIFDIRMILSETHSGPLSNKSVIALESDALCRDVAFLVIMSVYSTLGPSDAYMRQ